MFVFNLKCLISSRISVSLEEIEKFAKQILVYNNPKIILLALSTTDVSNEARYICVVISESCPIPSLMTDKGTFFYLEYVCIHLRHLFPKVVSYNRFVELEKKALLVIKLWGNENIKYCHLSKLSLTEMRIFRRLSIFQFLNDR